MKDVKSLDTASLNDNETAVAASLGHELAVGADRIVEKNGIFMSWDNDDKTFHVIDAWRTKPSVLDTGGQNVSSMESFISHANIQAKIGESAILFSAKNMFFSCVLDYFGDGSSEGLKNKAIQFRPMFSKDFDKWNRFSGQNLDQDDFSEFLEDNVDNILSPSGSELLSICSTLQVTGESYFSRSKRMADGTVQLEYKENQEAAGANKLSLPETFEVAVPLFAPSVSDPDPELSTFKVKLTYRLRSGKITFKYKILNKDAAILSVLSSMCAKVQANFEPEVPFFEVV